GSTFCSEETKSCPGFLKKRRAELINLKQVVNGKFMQDVEFNSSSTAAGCILGAAANGKVMWLYPDGTTLKAVAPSSGTYSANEPTLLHLAGKKA
ncbi:DUF4357 domain-containing protein, partial [Lactobacillus delbrueckii subsp. bulgaricus]